MKVVFIGGGALRYLGVARSILAENGIMENGEINVFDLSTERAEVMGRMIMKSPEYSGSNCKIVWNSTLDQALESADIVTVVLFAGGRDRFMKDCMICNKYGFIGSDQLSPSGAFLALMGGPIIMNIARKMEKLCPNALLIDFANPVAVLSAAVNNHTSIRCLGVCAGYTNHIWDLNRMLGQDIAVNDFTVKCAGVNHMSFIMRDSYYKDKNLYEAIDEKVTNGWTLPKLSDRWNEVSSKNILNGIETMFRLYEKYNWLIFSTEGDGMAYLEIEQVYNKSVKNSQKTDDMIKKQLAEEYANRQKADTAFKAFINNSDESIWSKESPETLNLLRADDNIMTRCIRAVSGLEEMRVATSYINNGAVKGYMDRTVLEYSQILSKDGIKAMDGLEVPPIFYGLVASLANHQTLLGDAIATEDPRILFDALYAYPVQQDTSNSKALFKELIQQNEKVLPQSFQQAIHYLNI